MDPLPASVLAALGDGVAELAADGRIAPRNEAMHAVLAACSRPGAHAGDLRALGVEAADEARLRGGEPVDIGAKGRHWRLRAVAGDGGAWLLATETTGEWRSGAARLELTRLRALAKSSGTIVHDFNNMLNAAIGLSATLRPMVVDPLDVQLLQELTAGTQQGAQLMRSVARMLMKAGVDRTRATLSSLVEEAMALAAKGFMQRGVKATVAPTAAPVQLRVDASEAVQSLWHGLTALCEMKPPTLLVAADAETVPLLDGRPRRCARVRLVAEGVDPTIAAETVRLLGGASGWLRALGSSALTGGLGAAVFVQRRHGGDLTAALAGPQLTLTYLWPALG